MNTFSLTHLSDQALLLDLGTLLTRDRHNTAVLLAHIAEVDARKLYLPAACSSMFVYCVQELRLSEDEARARIRVARLARQHPEVFPALAEGRLNVTAVLLLASHLTRENASELVAMASLRTLSEIQQLLADRFPRLPVPCSVEPLLPAAAPCEESSPEEELAAQPLLSSQRVSKRVDLTITASTVRPLAPDSFALQCTIRRETHEKLLYAKALLGHKVPAGDLPEVLDQALDALIQSLEKGKFAATARPRTSRAPSRVESRHVPAEVKRAVWERDGGQCTFVGPAGRRCPERCRLEFDHVEEFARGGKATVEGMRLLCRAHNQYSAERTFGEGFMRQRREHAQLAAEERRARAAGARCAREAAEGRTRAAAQPPPELDVTPWLRKLGFRADEARRAAEGCNLLPPEATLEERLRAALAHMDSGRPSRWAG